MKAIPLTASMMQAGARIVRKHVEGALRATNVANEVFKAMVAAAPEPTSAGSLHTTGEWINGEPYFVLDPTLIGKPVLYSIEAGRSEWFDKSQPNGGNVSARYSHGAYALITHAEIDGDQVFVDIRFDGEPGQHGRLRVPLTKSMAVGTCALLPDA